jgi:hypothetical protein
MKFNPEINLGTVVEICVFVLAVMGAMRKVGTMEAKLNIMYAWFTSNIISHQHDVRNTERFFGKKEDDC